MSQNTAFNDFFKNDFFKNGFDPKNTFDFSQLASAGRRNFEAASAISQIAVKNAQAISSRQAEIARENVESAMQASKDLMSGGKPEINLAKNADAARDFFDGAMSNLREMTEMVTKSNLEAYDILNQRATESMDELSQKPKTTAKKSSK